MYRIFSVDQKLFTALLMNHRREPNLAPLRTVHLQKSNGDWLSNTNDQNLSIELILTIRHHLSYLNTIANNRDLKKPMPLG